jgi:hypothetical protein
MAKNQRLIMCIHCGGSSTKAISDTASKTNAGLELSATTRTTLVMDSDIIEVPRAYSLKIVPLQLSHFFVPSNIPPMSLIMSLISGRVRTKASPSLLIFIGLRGIEERKKDKITKFELIL